jgi:hypothetical protein
MAGRARNTAGMLGLRRNKQKGNKIASRQVWASGNAIAKRP